MSLMRTLNVTVHPGNFETFMDEFADQLTISYIERPTAYLRPYDETLEQVRKAVASGRFYKDTETFKRTCKALGIKNTYKAIAEFIS